MKSLILPLIFHIEMGPFYKYNQIFEVNQTRIAESDYHEYETDYVDEPATIIENVLLDFNKCDQLIITHHHAKCKINPFHYLDLL